MEDEITKEGQGESEETTSAGKGETTSQKAEKMVSEKEVQKRLSDQAATFGREKQKLTQQLTDAQATLQSNQSELDSTNSRLRDVEREIRESKLNRDDPAAVSLFQERESLITERDALAKEKRAHAAEVAKLAEDRKAVTAERIALIASQCGADVEDLKSLGTDNMEVVERYAKAVGKKKAKESKESKAKTEKESEESEEGEEFTPDSGTGKGESDDLKLNEDEQENISADELHRRMKKKNPSLL